LSFKLLEGKSVVVTRASHQNSDLIEALSNAGAKVVAAPAIAVVPPLDGGQPLDDALIRLERFSWVAFTSTNSVAALLARGARRGVLKKFSHLQIAVVGPTTAAKVASEMGREPDLIPVHHDGVSLAKAFPKPKPGDRALVPMASDGRTDLVDGLRARGWQVDGVAAYRTVFPSLNRDLVSEAINADVVTFASPSAVKGHLEQTGGKSAAKVVVIGETTARECERLGVRVTFVAEEQSVEGLVQAVASVAGQR
jgi:uroporphyrinogen-III synthase